MAKNNTTGKANNGKTTTPQKRVYNRKPKAPTTSETPTADSIPNTSSSDFEIKINEADFDEDDSKSAFEGSYEARVSAYEKAQELENTKEGEIQSPHNSYDDTRDVANDTDPSAYDSMLANKDVVMESIKMAKESGDPAYIRLSEEAKNRKERGMMVPIDIEEEFNTEIMQTGRFLSCESYIKILNNGISPINPQFKAYYEIMKRMLIPHASFVNKRVPYTLLPDMAMKETLPSDKFVTIANMVRFIQCRLEETSWYVGLLKIDCIVLKENGTIWLYSVNDKGNISTGYSPLNSVVAEFGAELIAPVIVNNEIVPYDRTTTRVQYPINCKKKHAKLNKKVSKNIGAIINSFYNNNNSRIRSFAEDKILAYWTSSYADKLYPIYIINKAIEEAAYPIIFSSKCFIER